MTDPAERLSLRATALRASDPQAAGAERGGAIGRFLRRPAEAVDLDGFVARLEARRIRLRLDALAPAAVDPALAGRLRGALGDVLARTASPEAVAGRPCPWDPPCAFEALFRKQGRMTAGTDFPSPWVIAVTPRRGCLDVALTVFGIAREWAPAAAEALVEACRRIDWRAAAGVFVPAMQVLDRRVEDAWLPDLPAGTGLELDFVSPLAISGGDPREAPAAAFTSLGLRLEGLARWHGLTLAPVDWRAVAAAAQALDWTWSEVDAIRWQRGSRRQDRWIGMTGVTGRLHVGGAPDALARLGPLLRLGTLTHVGADVSFGCGRYRLVPDAGAASASLARS
jgi:hypothetical protein